MDDPFSYLLYLQQLQQQQAESATSIFDTITLWIVIAAIAPVFIKFIVIASAIKKFTGGNQYKPGPLGMIGPLLGFPAVVPKSSAEIASDRNHAYKKWGTLLSILCILGGLYLFAIGVTGNASVEIPTLVKITNAAPGTVLFVLGFLFWKNAHK